MSAERQRLRPWLEDKINSGKVPGLGWRNKELKEFRVSWKHAGKPDFVVEKDAMLFKLWAEHTGKYRPGESADPSTWKTRFRCALHKMPDVEEVRVPHSLDEKEPYRVFRFKEKESSPKRNSSSPKSDETQNGKRTMYRPKADSVIRAAPSAKDNIFFNNYPILSGSQSYGGRQQDSPQHDSSDSSIEDDLDLDNITPTIPPYPSHAFEPMLTDEQACGNSANSFFPNANGHGFLNGDFMSNAFIRQLPSTFESLGLSNGEILEAIFAANNGQLANGSAFGENGQTLFQRHLMTAHYLKNMKHWLQGGVSPDESSDVSSVSTHLNMDNGLIEPAGMEMDDAVGRMVTIPHLNENAASLFSRTGKWPGENCDSTAMIIRVFYGNREVFSTDTRLTESERLVRIFHGSHMGDSRQFELSLLSQIYGPPTARQIELPLANNCSKETLKVMDFLKRGILLEINEAHDIFVTRLCLTRVFYSNGRKAAKKLEREERTKVFDYQRKFLPTLRESRNGNREYPAYEVTLYLGRGDASLVSIVITHVMAKMSLYNASTAGESFWSEPNLNDQLATNLEDDCMY
ncbi:uncharacterized protein LOC144649601 isoform X2 [Oculina patagonica]